jgi:hypothetical protein
LKSCYFWTRKNERRKSSCPARDRLISVVSILFQDRVVIRREKKEKFQREESSKACVGKVILACLSVVLNVWYPFFKNHPATVQIGCVKLLLQVLINTREFPQQIIILLFLDSTFNLYP